MAGFSADAKMPGCRYSNDFRQPGIQASPVPFHPPLFANVRYLGYRQAFINFNSIIPEVNLLQRPKKGLVPIIRGGFRDAFRMNVVERQQIVSIFFDI
ncbi:hypothetical protein [Geobacter sp. SVR]|uniref:hypothetical protein n=1 Tax=Geobacter sp. SVR TaxID=2495594 RepID=UPI0015642EFA|nr:hypothetical protein [Geobacter sp. SVR]